MHFARLPLSRALRSAAGSSLRLPVATAHPQRSHVAEPFSHTMRPPGATEKNESSLSLLMLNRLLTTPKGPAPCEVRALAVRCLGYACGSAPNSLVTALAAASRLVNRTGEQFGPFVHS